MKCGEENGPQIRGGETWGGLAWIATWPGRWVMVALPESTVVVTLAADAPGATAIAAAAAPATNNGAK